MSERFAWIFDKQKQKKIWCADMWARKAVLAIRTAITGITSRLTTIEGAGYQTASDVSAAIASAIGGITELEYLVVSTLPASGTKGVIYLVPHQHGTRDIYDEYIWVNNAFEKIGSTDVDLSQYLLKTDISAWAKASTKPTYTASEVGALPDTTQIPTKVSDLTNDSGFITGYTETDPTVPAWAKTPSKPTYTAYEVGALPDSTEIPSKTSDLTNDSGFITSSSVPSAYTSNPQMDGTASAGSSTAWARGDHRHPTDTSRQAALSSTQLAAVNSGVTAAKVQEWDAIEIPTKTSELTNDSGFITSAPVQSVNGQTGVVSLDAADVGALPDSTFIPSKTSDLTNDSGYLTSIPGAPVYYGTCNTAANAAAKVVDCPDFVLKTGAIVAIYFANGQTYAVTSSSPCTINVNGTGAYPMLRASGRATPQYVPQYFFQGGVIIEFIFDGSGWVALEGRQAGTTYYGLVKLTTSLTSSSTMMALTASAGKSLQDQIKALSDRVTALGG